MRTGIYRIVHTESGRCYVGQAVNIDKRWTEHKWHLNQGGHHTSRLQRTWTKYGATAFRFQVLEECPAEVLTEREQYWMDLLRPVFNSSQAAGSIRGMKFGARSEETRAKMKARWTPERRAAQGARAKANPPKWAAESRAKASATHTGRPKPKSPEALATQVEANRRRVWDAEARARLGATQKARLAAMSETERVAMTAGCRTEEARAKMSAAWTPERRAKFAAATRARAAAARKAAEDQ